MKKIIILLVITLLFGVAYAKEEKEVKYRAHLFSLSFISDKEGWAVGDHGIVYHTTDGGLNWEKQSAKTDDALFSVSFADNRNGWIVGNRGIILHTTNGGKTWVKQKAPKDKALFTVKALSPEKVWAGGDWGTMLYTEDGGKTWEDRTYPQDVIIYSIDFYGQEEGWATGEFGTILHTTDGGRTWKAQKSGMESTAGIESTTLFSVSFTSPKEGLVVGIDGLILKTEDGGKTWKPIVFVDPDKRPLFDVKLLGTMAIAVGAAGTTWTQLPLKADKGLSWFTAVALIKNGQGTKGIIVGRQSVAVLTENNSLKTVGFLPPIEMKK